MAQIDTYRSGEAVSLSFAFNVLDIESATYTVRDGAGAIIVDNEPLDITEGQMSIPVVVSANTTCFQIKSAICDTSLSKRWHPG